jgi:hypothetical protein
MVNDGITPGSASSGSAGLRSGSQAAKPISKQSRAREGIKPIESTSSQWKSGQSAKIGELYG